MPVLALLLLLAPDRPAYEIRYRFEKGMVCEDRSVSRARLRLFAGANAMVFDQSPERVLRRTVLEVDGEGRLVAERVEVEKFLFHLKESPDQPAGTKPFKSHGKTFVWRSDGGTWRLLEGDEDVTKSYPRLVEVLRNWGDARLPKRRVAVGDTWEVGAAEFLKNVGQPVPEGIEGRCVFTLESVDGDGVARITFRFKRLHRDKAATFTGDQKGVWLFDVRRGRNLEFSMEGTLIVEGKRRGDGKVSMKRTLTYPSAS